MHDNKPSQQHMVVICYCSMKIIQGLRTCGVQGTGVTVSHKPLYEQCTEHQDTSMTVGKEQALLSLRMLFAGDRLHTAGSSSHSKHGRRRTVQDRSYKVVQPSG